MIEDPRPRPRRWWTALIVAAAIVHLVAVAGVAVATAWRVEKVEVAPATPPATNASVVRQPRPEVEVNVAVARHVPRPRIGCQLRDDDEVPPSSPPIGRGLPVVPPVVAKGLRLSGDENIVPSPEVRLMMRRRGMTQLHATVQVCVAENGRVTQLRLLRSSRFRAHDQKLLSTMRTWRYRPYQVAGRPSPMCSVSRFMYRTADGT